MRMFLPGAKIGEMLMMAIPAAAAAAAAAGPCDIYAAGLTPCVAAHSTVRALYGSYAGPLYQLQRTPAAGNARKDIAVRGAGGKADAAAHTAFCRDATCTVERIYDQSPRGNHLGIEQGLPFLKGQPRGAHDRAAVRVAPPLPVASRAVLIVSVCCVAGWT